MANLLPNNGKQTKKEKRPDKVMVEALNLVQE